MGWEASIAPIASKTLKLWRPVVTPSHIILINIQLIIYMLARVRSRAVFLITTITPVSHVLALHSADDNFWIPENISYITVNMEELQPESQTFGGSHSLQEFS